uniref:Carbohydrate esterase 2 N-terminal domain-containing protein n=1 Tax=Tanacetum cinerariifolium TaxID=118510 RepID=A0A699GEQ0_TANCI|nr:hypothetical protein [Tanacetum cinerariifolium]
MGGGYRTERGELPAVRATGRHAVGRRRRPAARQRDDARNAVAPAARASAAAAPAARARRPGASRAAPAGRLHRSAPGAAADGSAAGATGVPVRIPFAADVQGVVRDDAVGVDCRAPHRACARTAAAHGPAAAAHCRRLRLRRSLPLQPPLPRRHGRRAGPLSQRGGWLTQMREHEPAQLATADALDVQLAIGLGGARGQQRCASAILEVGHHVAVVGEREHVAVRPGRFPPGARHAQHHAPQERVLRHGVQFVALAGQAHPDAAVGAAREVVGIAGQLMRRDRDFPHAIARAFADQQRALVAGQRQAVGKAQALGDHPYLLSGGIEFQHPPCGRLFHGVQRGRFERGAPLRGRKACRRIGKIDLAAGGHCHRVGEAGGRQRFGAAIADCQQSLEGIGHQQRAMGIESQAQRPSAGRGHDFPSAAVEAHADDASAVGGTVYADIQQPVRAQHHRFGIGVAVQVDMADGSQAIVGGVGAHCERLLHALFEFADHGHDFFAVRRQFFLAHARDAAQVVQRRGAGLGDFAQGGVVEDDVGRDVVFARRAHAPRAQPVEDFFLLRRQVAFHVTLRGARRLLLGRFLILAQLHFLPAFQYRPGGVGEFQRAVLLVIDRQQPKRDHLAQDGAPLVLAAVGADAEHGQAVVVPGLDALGLHAAQHFDHVAGRKALVDPVHGRQQFLHRHRAVERDGRNQARVAVAARARLLAEVVEQAHAAAAQRFAQAQHGVELVAEHAFKRFVGFRFVDHPALQHHVLQAVGHPGAGGTAVAAGAARFLVIALDAFRQIEVTDETHVGLVDAHAEGDGGAHHDVFFAQEAGLVGGALGVVHAGVVRQRADAVFVQELGGLFDLLARQAVDDAAVARVLGGDEVEQLLAAITLFDDLVADVGPVERRDELRRIAQLQTMHDLGAGLRIGRGGERNARHVGELLVQHRQADAALGHQAFGRHVHQVDLAGAHQPLDAVRFFVGLGGIEEGRAHADFLERIDLVLHQCDQGRDDHAHAVAQQGGNLVTQRLAAAGRHQDQGVAAIAHMIDNLGLVAAKGGITEHDDNAIVTGNQDDQAKHDAIPGKNHEGVGHDVAQQPADAQERRDERGDGADGKERQVVHRQQRAVLVQRVHGGADQGGNGQEERELGGHLARKAEDHAAHDGGARTAGAGNQCERLRHADFQRVERGDLVERRDAFHGRIILGAFFHPQDDQAADDERGCHRDRRKQVGLDGRGENQAQDGGGQEGDQHVEREALLGAVVEDAGQDQADAGAEFPDHRHHGAGLDHDFKHFHFVFHTCKAQQVLGQDQRVWCTAEIKRGVNRRCRGRAPAAVQQKTALAQAQHARQFAAFLDGVDGGVDLGHAQRAAPGDRAPGFFLADHQLIEAGSELAADELALDRDAGGQEIIEAPALPFAQREFQRRRIVAHETAAEPALDFRIIKAEHSAHGLAADVFERSGRRHAARRNQHFGRGYERAGPVDLADKPGGRVAAHDVAVGRFQRIHHALARQRHQAQRPLQLLGQRRPQCFLEAGPARRRRLARRILDLVHVADGGRRRRQHCQRRSQQWQGQQWQGEQRGPRAWIKRPSLTAVGRRRRPLQVSEPPHRIGAAVAAHLQRRLQAAAKRRALGAAEDQAALVVAQLHAAHAGRLAMGHTGNRTGDRRRGAAGAAVRAAAERGGGTHRGRILPCLRAPAPVVAGRSGQPLRHPRRHPGAVVERQVVARVGVHVVRRLPGVRQRVRAARIDQRIAAARQHQQRRCWPRGRGAVAGGRPQLAQRVGARDRIFALVAEPAPQQAFAIEGVAVAAGQAQDQALLRFHAAIEHGAHDVGIVAPAQAFMETAERPHAGVDQHGPFDLGRMAAGPFHRRHAAQRQRQQRVRRRQAALAQLMAAKRRHCRHRRGAGQRVMDAVAGQVGRDDGGAGAGQGLGQLAGKAAPRAPVLLLARQSLGHPAAVTVDGTHQEIEPDQVPAQHPLQAVSGGGVEHGHAVEQLARIFLHPQPRAHFQRERQEHAVVIAGAVEVQVIPQVAVGAVLAALRLEHVVVVGVALAEQFFQRADVGQVRNRCGRVGMREPQAVAQAEAGMAVERHAELAGEQLAFDHVAHGLALRFHRSRSRTPVPRQARAVALATEHERHPVHGGQRRVAHQVHPLRIAARGLPHAARINQRHENQAHRFQLLVQRAVPAQPRQDAFHERQDDLGADPFQSMDAAKKTERRHVGAGVAERNRIHGELAAVHGDGAMGVHLQMLAAGVDQTFQGDQFWQVFLGHGARTLDAGNASVAEMAARAQLGGAWPAMLYFAAASAQNGLSNGKPSQNISVGVVSVVVAPVASVAESAQGRNPGAASGLALVGTSYVVAGIVEAGADAVELLLSSASTGAKLSVKLSGKAVHSIGVAVGNTVEFTAHASGTMLVAGCPHNEGGGCLPDPAASSRRDKHCHYRSRARRTHLRRPGAHSRIAEPGARYGPAPAGGARRHRQRRGADRPRRARPVEVPAQVFARGSGLARGAGTAVARGRTAQRLRYGRFGIVGGRPGQLFPGRPVYARRAGNGAAGGRGCQADAGAGRHCRPAPAARCALQHGGLPVFHQVPEFQPVGAGSAGLRQRRRRPGAHARRGAGLAPVGRLPAHRNAPWHADPAGRAHVQGQCRVRRPSGRAALCGPHQRGDGRFDADVPGAAPGLDHAGNQKRGHLPGAVQKAHRGGNRRRARPRARLRGQHHPHPHRRQDQQTADHRPQESGGRRRVRAIVQRLRIDGVRNGRDPRRSAQGSGSDGRSALHGHDAPPSAIFQGQQAVLPRPGRQVQAGPRQQLYPLPAADVARRQRLDVRSAGARALCQGGARPPGHDRYLQQLRAKAAVPAGRRHVCPQAPAGVVAVGRRHVHGHPGAGRNGPPDGRQGLVRRCGLERADHDRAPVQPAEQPVHARLERQQPGRAALLLGPRQRLGRAGHERPARRAAERPSGVQQGAGAAAYEPARHRRNAVGHGPVAPDAGPLDQPDDVRVHRPGRLGGPEHAHQRQGAGGRHVRGHHVRQRPGVLLQPSHQCRCHARLRPGAAGRRRDAAHAEKSADRHPVQAAHLSLCAARARQSHQRPLKLEEPTARLAIGSALLSVPPYASATQADIKPLATALQSFNLAGRLYDPGRAAPTADVRHGPDGPHRSARRLHRWHGARGRAPRQRDGRRAWRLCRHHPRFGHRLRRALDAGGGRGLWHDRPQRQDVPPGAQRHAQDGRRQAAGARHRHLFYFAPRLTMFPRTRQLYLVATLATLAVFANSANAAVQVSAADANLQYTGRIDFADRAAPVLSWPGTSIEGNFTGASLAVTLDDQHGKNWFNVFIDGDLARPKIIAAAKGGKTYEVATGLPAGPHRFLITKRTEGEEGATVFRGLALADGGTLLAPPPRKARKIAFFGDSITSGMGNESPEDGPDHEPRDKNNFMAYDAITARALDAEMHVVSQSGIGVMISWFPFIMPQFYNQLSAVGVNDSRWDFSQWTPDVVVINLFQNDKWLIDREQRLQPVPTDAQRIAAYKDFVQKIRAVYPRAYIVCALGSMDAVSPGSKWPGYVRSAVAQLREGQDGQNGQNGEQKDERIDTLFFDYTGFDKHPRAGMTDSYCRGLKLFPVAVAGRHWLADGFVRQFQCRRLGGGFGGHCARRRGRTCRRCCRRGTRRRSMAGRAASHLEHAHHFGQLDGLLLHCLRSGCRFFHQRRILLGHGIHLGHGGVDLLDADFLLAACRADFAHDLGHAAHAADDFFHRGAGLVDQRAAGAHFFHRVRDQLLDVLGGAGRAVRQVAHLGGNHGKAAALFPGAGRFDRRVQRQDVGLERNAVDDADDVGDLVRRFGDRGHGVHHARDQLAALDGNVRRRADQLVGLAGIVRVLLHGRGQFFQRRRGFFQAGRLLLGAARQVHIAGGDFVAGGGNRVAAVAHAAHGVGQAVLHLVQAVHQRAHLILATEVDGVGQVAVGNRIEVLERLVQRVHHGAQQHDGGDCSHDQAQHDGHDRERQVAVVGGLAVLVLLGGRFQLVDRQFFGRVRVQAEQAGHFGQHQAVDLGLVLVAQCLEGRLHAVLDQGLARGARLVGQRLFAGAERQRRVAGPGFVAGVEEALRAGDGLFGVGRVGLERHAVDRQAGAVDLDLGVGNGFHRRHRIGVDVLQDAVGGVERDDAARADEDHQDAQQNHGADQAGADGEVSKHGVVPFLECPKAGGLSAACFV